MILVSPPKIKCSYHDNFEDYQWWTHSQFFIYSHQSASQLHKYHTLAHPSAMMSFGAILLPSRCYFSLYPAINLMASFCLW